MTLYNQKRPTLNVETFEPAEALPDYLEEISPSYFAMIGLDPAVTCGRCDSLFGTHVMIVASGELVCPGAEVGRFSTAEVRVVTDEELARDWTPA